jgi:protoporphyrinogen oxidase
MSQSPVLVIGAGPAGLTAAYELAKRGGQSLILEADDQVGGLARTVNYKGYRFDVGGHRFFSKIPAINTLWQEILGTEFLIRPRLSRIYYDGHFFDYPLKALNALVGLGPVESLLVTLSYVHTHFFPHQHETTFEQWVSNRFGRRLYEIFFKTYTEKVWGIPCAEISADWAVQRIKNLSLNEALRNALFGAGRGRDGQVITTLIDSFQYPRLGPGMLWEQCEELLAGRGSLTVRGVRVERIRHHQGQVECIIGRTATGEVIEYGGSHVISTMPLRDLLFSLDPAPPTDVLQAVRRLRYRDYLTVVLMLQRADVFPDNWIYIHSPEVKMGRIQNYKNWSPEMVPDPSRTALGLEYFLWEHDEEWSWPQERLLDLGIRECMKIGLLRPGEVEDGTVVRMPKAYPVYDQGYQENVALVRRYLETFINLQTIGRNGLHRYNNQDHSMLTGIYAARNILGERNDVWSVNTEMEYHEEQRSPVGQPGDRLVPTRVAPTIPLAPTPDELVARVFAQLDPLALGVAIGIVSGFTLFLMTTVLLLKGGEVVGPTLSLLGHYLPWFAVTWVGAGIGGIEAALGGFVVGYGGAWLRNIVLAAYASLVQQRADAKERRHLLDKV